MAQMYKRQSIIISKRDRPVWIAENVFFFPTYT